MAHVQTSSSAVAPSEDIQHGVTWNFREWSDSPRSCLSCPRSVIFSGHSANFVLLALTLMSTIFGVFVGRHRSPVRQLRCLGLFLVCVLSHLCMYIVFIRIPMERSKRLLVCTKDNAYRFETRAVMPAEFCIRALNRPLRGQRTPSSTPTTAVCNVPHVVQLVVADRSAGVWTHIPPLRAFRKISKASRLPLTGASSLAPSTTSPSPRNPQQPKRRITNNRQNSSPPSWTVPREQRRRGMRNLRRGHPRRRRGPVQCRCHLSHTPPRTATAISATTTLAMDAPRVARRASHAAGRGYWETTRLARLWARAAWAR